MGITTTASGEFHGYLWQNGAMTDLGVNFGGFGGSSSQALLINNAGQIVGDATDAAGNWHTFLWQNGKVTDLGISGFFATGINNSGQIVGQYNDESIEHSVLWQNGTLTELGTPSGFMYTVAMAINDSGQIVGSVNKNVIPLPSAVLLLGAGLGRLVLYGRRKMAAKN